MEDFSGKMMDTFNSTFNNIMAKETIYSFKKYESRTIDLINNVIEYVYSKQSITRDDIVELVLGYITLKEGMDVVDDRYLELSLRANLYMDNLDEPSLKTLRKSMGYLYLDKSEISVKRFINKLLDAHIGNSMREEFGLVNFDITFNMKNLVEDITVTYNSEKEFTKQSPVLNLSVTDLITLEKLVTLNANIDMVKYYFEDYIKYAVGVDEVVKDIARML